MSHIRTVTPAQAQGPVRAMYERQQGSRGYVPNYARAFSSRPELMPLWAELLGGIRRNVEPRRFELATLAAAAALGSTYCSLAHGEALCRFLPPAAVASIARAAAIGEVPGEWPELDAQDLAVLRFAVNAARRPGEVEAADVEALRRNGIGDTEIFDLAATVAARAFFASLIESLGTRADAAWAGLRVELRNALTVGRPIANAPLEVLPPAG